MVADVKIEGEYITLAQLLKKLNLISSAGEARTFLQEYEVLVNGQPEVRRGRKIRPGDQVIINGNQHNVI